MDWLKSKYGEYKTTKAVKKLEELEKKARNERNLQSRIKENIARSEKRKRQEELNYQYALIHGNNALANKKAKENQQLFNSMYEPYFEKEQEARRQKQKDLFMKHRMNQQPGSRFSFYPLQELDPNNMNTGTMPSSRSNSGSERNYITNDSTNWWNKAPTRSLKAGKRDKRSTRSKRRLTHLTRKHR